MDLRIARESDLPGIVAIYNQAVAARSTADLQPVTVEGRGEWLRRHDSLHPVVVAVEEDEIVGWAAFGEYRGGRLAVRHTAEISYYVHDDHRRRGVATTLLRDCIGRCAELGIKTLFAIVLDDNAASVRLLESLGFGRWGHMPRIADFDGREVGHLYYGLRVG